MNQIDPVSLRLFIRVVETGTIAAAAEAEHLSAAAVSKRLSELETVLSSQLLQRTNKGVEPTGAGLALTKLARSALAELDQVRVQMESFSSGVRGLVRVCASMSAITQFLSEPLRSFLDEHPNVQVQLEERLSPMVVKAVAENAADVGIFLPLVAMPPNLEQHGYHSDRLALITPKGHPLSLRKTVTLPDLLAHDLIGLHTGSAINILLNRAAQEARREVNIKIQVTSFDALCTMVSTGLGIALLPESMARRNARTVPLHICRLDEPWARRQFALCVRSRTTLPAAAQLLMDHLLAPLQAGSEKERQP